MRHMTDKAVHTTWSHGTQHASTQHTSHYCSAKEQRTIWRDPIITVSRSSPQVHPVSQAQGPVARLSVPHAAMITPLGPPAARMPGACHPWSPALTRRRLAFGRCGHGPTAISLTTHTPLHGAATRTQAAREGASTRHTPEAARRWAVGTAQIGRARPQPFFCCRSDEGWNSSTATPIA